MPIVAALAIRRNEGRWIAALVGVQAELIDAAVPAPRPWILMGHPQRAARTATQLAESGELAKRNLALAEQLGDAGLLAQALSRIGLPGRQVHVAQRRLYLDRAIDLALQVGKWARLSPQTSWRVEAAA